MDSQLKNTPLMNQYWEMKKQHLDKIMLFRMGDFFEMFYDDAIVAAPILNIALTKRNKKSIDETPMCGVPYHSVSSQITKLLAAGKKIAICDQVEDPKNAKGIVKRAVTRCLSPGMVYDPESLDQLTANYLCSFDKETVSFLDTTTGDAFFYRESSVEEQWRLIKVLSPVELVLEKKDRQNIFSRDWPEEMKHFILSTHDINQELLEQNSEKKGEQTRSRNSVDRLPKSSQRLLSYALTMQGSDLKLILKNFVERRLEKRLILSPTVLRHLEVFTTYRGVKKGSLFYAINRTKTSAGARCLKYWLQFPLTSLDEIKGRLEQVESWVKRPNDLQELRVILGQMGDVERRLGKISHPQCTPRDIESLKDSLEVGLSIRSHFQRRLDLSVWQTAENLVQQIKSTLVDESPITLKDGGYIRRGFHAQLDECISLSEDSQSLLLQLEDREKKSTGITSLKIRYNNVFGYYIEVTNTHKHKVPAHYLRKQTLTNAERYTTDELTELEKKVLLARTQRVELEKEIFRQLRSEILKKSIDLFLLAKEWSELDVVTSLAWLAIEYKYQRPQLYDMPLGKSEKINEKENSKNFQQVSLDIRGSRHPVVEQEVMEKRFVPNDIFLSLGECLLLTGPNMAGKSTIMRQVALTVILAQIGSFVPATSAHLPIFQRIFTRIGASDYLSEGLSTFMVEMKETAEMLKEANAHSLVILDEVGRGTSTYDGMCLAQAILEFLLERKQAMTFFATHYHELTQLADRLSSIKNAHMTIVEKMGDIQFLHTLAKGPANKSYGIQVAKLAGLPGAVTQRAQNLLNKMEAFQTPQAKQMSFLDMADGLS